jgi:hypothetical protein
LANKEAGRFIGCIPSKEPFGFTLSKRSGFMPNKQDSAAAAPTSPSKSIGKKWGLAFVEAIVEGVKLPEYPFVDFAAGLGSNAPGSSTGGGKKDSTRRAEQGAPPA